MTSSKLRVAMVGAGGISRTAHIPGWKRLNDVEVVAIADVNPEAAQVTAEEFGIPNVLASYRDLIKMPEIDAIDICTPNRTHTPIVLSALAEGKHVLCEKPLAVTPGEVVSMIKAEQQARRVLMVTQNNRYRGISLAIKQWVDAGNLGDVYYARAWALRRNLLPPGAGFIQRSLSGGGPCMDIGVHILDLVMWLMDFPEPVTVTGAAMTNLAKTNIMPGAWGEWPRDKFDVEDFACGMIRFKNGTMLSLESSWLAHLPEPENMSCTLFGTKAGVSWPSGAVSSSNDGKLVDSTIEPADSSVKPHFLVIADFYDAIVNNKPSPLSADNALKVIKILDGIYRSQRIGKEVRL